MPLPLTPMEITPETVAFLKKGFSNNMVAQIVARQKVIQRMCDERETLIEKYPEKWVVMGKEGMLFLGDS